MELLPPYSASLGAMGSLAGKLDALLDAKFKDEIGRLGIRLLKLSKARDPPLTARCWMKDVRQLSCELESYIATESDWIDKISGVFRARVKEANRRYNRYMLKSVPSCRDAFPTIDHRFATVAGGRKIDPVVVGLHDEGSVFDRLCPLLTDGDEQLKVLSIVGVGGIGKTTLAKQLWRMHKVGDYFSCRAFVRTAKKPDMRRILRSILAQVRPHQPPDASEVHDLIHDLTEYLRDKRYLIIIDDLWASSVWDVARRAFPEGNCGSRIITTTETADVALACCSYQSRCIFEMIPLSISQSKELFNTVVFGTGEEKSHQLDKVSDEIIRRCAGLPQAIITISGVLGRQWEAYTVQNREMIQNSLPTNATYAEILKQVLNCCYNCLPSCLQTCLLYLSLYPENYLILKEDIMKQWVVEGFIPESTEKDSIKVAGIYFDMLVNMGMIQHIDVDYSDEVLYYVVHHMVHAFITSKSIEENFITVMDYSQRTIQLSNKVSRLSLQFGSATHATLPASTGLSQVRSFAFFGLMRCLPSIFEFELLRSLILHIWVDQPSTGLDLKPTSELVLLRSFQVTSNDTVQLPDLMQGLKHLETLEINARVAPIPANIFHLRNWLHLRVGRGTELPHVTGFLTNVNLNHPVTLDEFSNPPNSVKTIELFPSICKIPKWIEQLTKLSILNIVVRELQRGDIHNLQRLPLTFLSLYVQRRTREQISFSKDAFSALEYFEFRCGVLRLTFEEGAMPNLQRLKLGFNARGGHQHDSLLDGIAHLSKVQEIFGIIGSVPGTEESHWLAAESAFKDDSGKHANNVSIKRVHMVEEEYGLPEKQHLIREKDESSRQLGIPKQKYLEDAKKDTRRNSEPIQRRSNNKEHASVAPRNKPVPTLGKAVAAARMKGEYPYRVGQPECQTGTCKFGATCKFHHPREKAAIATRAQLNVLGYPLRPNEKECTYYLRTGQCKFASTCKFHHPQPSSTMVAVRSSVYSPGQSATSPGQNTYPGAVTNWNLSRSASFIASPRWPGPSGYAQVILPQGLVQVPGWNHYAAQMGSSSSDDQQRAPGTTHYYSGSHQSETTGMGDHGMFPSYQAGSVPLGVYAVQGENIFPERPDQPECQFYMKTGDCKFGAVCKFNHPKERMVPAPNCALSSLGLPLRPGEPVCTFYSRYGICKFGPNCKFDHPMGTLMYGAAAPRIGDVPALHYQLAPSPGHSERLLDGGSGRPHRVSQSDSQQITSGDGSTEREAS